MVKINKLYHKIYILNKLICDIKIISIIFAVS
jgi:hypothetical protein